MRKISELISAATLFMPSSIFLIYFMLTVFTVGSNFLWKIIKIENGCENSHTKFKGLIKSIRDCPFKQGIYYSSLDKRQQSKLSLPTHEGCCQSILSLHRSKLLRKHVGRISGDYVANAL